MFVLLCALAQDFFDQSSKRTFFDQCAFIIQLLSVCAYMLECVYLCEQDNVARLRVLNLRSGANMTCSVTQQQLFLCLFLCLSTVQNFN